MASPAMLASLVALSLLVPAAAATLPDETDPVCGLHTAATSACLTAGTVVDLETPLCFWPVYNRVPCNLVANPVIQDDAGSGRDAGNDLATAVAVGPGFHEANIAPVADAHDRFTFSASAGDSLRFRYDGAVTMYLIAPSGDALSSGYVIFDGTAPETGTYTVHGVAKEVPYNYYFCLVVAGDGPVYC